MRDIFKPPSIFDDGETIMPRKKPVAFAESEAADHTETQMRENRKYIVLDAALWGTDIDSVFELGNKHCCLFATKAAEHELDYVAPYLFAYVAGDELSKRVKYRETTGMRALYISSHLSPEQLRKHLRQFLRVKTEDGKWMLFRFYDPEVSHLVIPALTEEQRKYFFNGIENLTYFQSKTHQNYETLVPDHKSAEDLPAMAREKKIFPLIISNAQFETVKRAMLVFFHQQMFFALRDSKYFPQISDGRIYEIIEKQTQKLAKYKIYDDTNVKTFIETSFRYPVLCEDELPAHLNELMLRYSDEIQKIQAIVNYLNYNNNVL